MQFGLIDSRLTCSVEPKEKSLTHEFLLADVILNKR